MPSSSNPRHFPLSVRCLVLAGLATILVATGCSNKPRPYPVNGQIVFDDGEPLTGGRIEVRSLEHPLVARGSVDRDGKFQLTTYEFNDGAVAGKHEVLIVKKFTANIDDVAKHAKHAALARTLDSKYTRYRTSGLTIDVEPGDNNEVKLQVTSE